MLMDKIVGGETGDLAVLSAEAIDGLIASGVLQKGSRVDLAKSSIGVAIRRGMVAPDIGSVDALKAALLAAKSVMYSKTGISGVYMPKLLEKLGIADRDRAEGQEPVARHRRRGAGARRSRDRAAADQRIAAGAGHQGDRPAAGRGAAGDGVLRRDFLRPRPSRARRACWSNSSPPTPRGRSIRRRGSSRRSDDRLLAPVSLRRLRFSQQNNMQGGSDVRVDEQCSRLPEPWAR